MLHFRKGRATNKEVKIEDHHDADNALSVARAALLQDSQLPGADRLPADCSVQPHPSRAEQCPIGHTQ